jgi:hypothetical protein
VSYRIYLDDVRRKPETTHEWVVVKSLSEFKRVIAERGLPEFVGFDHDLNESHYAQKYADGQTGYDAAVWLDEHCCRNNLPFPKWAVHSMSASGVERIKMRLTGRWRTYYPSGYWK